MGTLEPPTVGMLLSFATSVTAMFWTAWPLVLGLEEETDTSLDMCFFSVAVAVLPAAHFLSLDEPWIHLWVVGTLGPPVVGPVLSFATSTPPMFWMAWPHVPGFKVELDVC